MIGFEVVRSSRPLAAAGLSEEERDEIVSVVGGEMAGWFDDGDAALDMTTEAAASMLGLVLARLASTANREEGEHG